MQPVQPSFRRAARFWTAYLFSSVSAVFTSSQFLASTRTFDGCVPHPLAFKLDTVAKPSNYRQHCIVTTTIQNMSKLDSPAAERNKTPIWKFIQDEVLNLLNYAGQESTLTVLEIAAGSGIHAAHFTKQLLQLGRRSIAWQPADSDDKYRSSIQAYIDQDPALTNVVLPPLPLTLNELGVVEAATLSGKSFDLIVNINMIHIAPIEALYGLMKVASEHLQSGRGCLLLYGPFKVGGQCVESNQYVWHVATGDENISPFRPV